VCVCIALYLWVLQPSFIHLFIYFLDVTSRWRDLIQVRICTGCSCNWTSINTEKLLPSHLERVQQSVPGVLLEAASRQRHLKTFHRISIATDKTSVGTELLNITKP
jgi:hypothetical protein